MDGRKEGNMKRKRKKRDRRRGRGRGKGRGRRGKGREQFSQCLKENESWPDVFKDN